MASEEINLGTFETGAPVGSVCYNWTIKNLDVVSMIPELAQGQHVQFNFADDKGVKYTWRVSLDRVTSKHAGGQTDFIRFNKTLISISPDVDGVQAGKGICSVCTLKIPNLHSKWAKTPSAANRPDSFTRSCLNLRDAYCTKIGPDALEVGESATAEMLAGEIGETWPPKEATVHVKFTQYSSTYPSTKLHSAKRLEQRTMADLSRLLARIKGDKTTADVNILSQDGINFPAHRFILSARSPVFQAMFQTTMKEASSGEIECDDLSGKCLKALLHFFYTGNLADDWDDVEVLWELAYAAEKYQVKDLLEFLDASLAAMCTPQEAPTLLILANKLSLKKAERQLFNLIKTSATDTGDFVATMECLMKCFVIDSS